MTPRAGLARALDAWGDPLGPPARTRTGTVLFVLLVLGVAFHDLGARSLHTLDLPRFGTLAREMIQSGEWLVPTRYGEVYANKPPLHIWLTALPAAALGEVTPFLVRLPSALGLVLLVLFTDAWGRSRTRSPAAGRAAALLLLGTFVVTRFGREGRPDMLASGLVVGGAFLLDRAARGVGLRGDPWLAGVLLGLALLAKGPPPLLFPLLVLLLPSEGRTTRERLRAARPLVALGAALALAALWFVPAGLHAGWDYARTLALDQASDRLAGDSTHVEPAAYYFVRLLDGGLPWTPLYLLALLHAPGRGRRGDTRSLVLAAVLSLLLFSLVPTKHLRYVIPVFALLAVAAGWQVAWLLFRPAGRGWPLVLRASAVLSLLLAGALLAAEAWVPGVLLPALGPAGGLVLLAAAGLCRPAGGDDPQTAARRRWVGSLLVLVALLGSAFWIVRDRHRVRGREAFDRAVARVLPPVLPPGSPTGLPADLPPEAILFTLAPVEPEAVFHGAPFARLARTPADLPGPTAAPHLLVLAERSARHAVEAARGGPAAVLLEQDLSEDGPPVLLLEFRSGR